MMKVADLTPGLYIELSGKGATVISLGSHPLDPGMALVVWELEEGKYSFDSLAWMQDVGGADPEKNTPEQRHHRLLQIFNRVPR